MSSLIIWEDKYNTGNFIIDYQHQRLFKLINDLDEERQHEDFKPSLLTIILEELTNYTKYHFQKEEEIMDETNYSSKEEHKLLHRDFIKNLNNFKTDYQAGVKDIDQILCLYLKDWLINHIATEDLNIISEVSLGHGVS